MIKLTDEQREELQARDGVAEVQDDLTEKTYFIAEGGFFRKALEALKAQEDMEAIRKGIAEMRAGNFSTLAEADERIRSQLGMPAATK